MNVGGPILYHVPVLNRFRFPFKLIYFGLFFESVLAVLAIARWKEFRRRIALAVFMASWIWVFLFLPNHAWRVREYHPPLAPRWQSLLPDGRYVVFSNNPLYSPSDTYAEFNYALLFGLDNLLGYEPMHSHLGAKVALGNLHTGAFEGTINDSVIQHLKRWSVRYVLLSPERTNASASLAEAGYCPKASAGQWVLWEDPDVLPRVRWSAHADLPPNANNLHWTHTVNSLDIDVANMQAGSLDVAFAANPGLEVCVDNRCAAAEGADDGSLRVGVPAGSRHVRIAYHNSLFLPSILIALAVAGVLPAILRWMHSAHNP